MGKSRPLNSKLCKESNVKLTTPPMAATFILHLFILIQSLQIHYSDSQSLQSLQTLFTTFNARGTSNYCPSSTSSSVAINLPTFIPNSSLTLICYNNIITQLHITGDNNNNFDHENLSTESFFYTISTIFPGLKVLSLVSLSLNGPLPASVLANSVSSLEILNVSSNCFHGDIPFELSYLKNLHTLVLDHNNFSGPVPDWIGYKLPSLTVLSFKNNSLDGYLPFSLARLVSLRVLDLSRNQLSGDVPVDFKNLTNLQVLDLESNQLGPSFPVLHNRLLVLVLRGNRFGNGIQGFDLRSFYQLRKLDLSSNEFNGPFPDFVFSLPSISYLNFSGNKFTGKLSANVSCSNDLVSVDLSFNRFTGELPTCMQELENNRRESVLYGWNCLSNVDRKQQHNVSFCHNEALAVMIKPPVSGNDSSKLSKEKVVVASSVVGGVVVGGVAVFGVVLIAIRSEYFGGGCAATPQIRVLVEKISPAYTLKMLTDARYISETMKLGGVGILYRTYVLGELIEATNNFHKSTFMGNGSHGQLYKGQLNDGSIVAIRNLNLRKKCSIQSCTRQIELISKLRHPNLVNPIGHCFDRHPDDSAIIPRVFLVFEFVPNGTLRASLTVGQKFSWAQRLSAAIGISKGIQFLNTRITTKIFPYNLKITDVLLDQSFQVKISGYNLPLLAENKVSAGHSFTKSSETLGRRFETEEDDNDHDHVYDLGVIMLELILGRAIDCSNDITVAKDMLHVSLVADEVARRSILDPLIRKECCDESLKTLMELCVRCLSKDRPSIDDVLWNLEFIAQTDHTSSTDDLTNNHILKDDTVVCITERIERY